ncbi:MAG: hypothetical protein ABJH22_01755 [Marinomonas sp.]
MALAACDSGAVPSPAERQLQQSAAPVLAEDVIVLSPQGIGLGAKTLYFSADKAEVMSALDLALGQPIASNDNMECGAGRVASATYALGLSVNFQNDHFAGWSTNDRTGALRVAGAVQVGMTRDAAETAAGYSLIAGSSLGEEFTLGAQMGGFVEDDGVNMIYAGTQCFFR